MPPYFWKDTVKGIFCQAECVLKNRGDRNAESSDEFQEMCSYVNHPHSSGNQAPGFPLEVGLRGKSNTVLFFPDCDRV